MKTTKYSPMEAKMQADYDAIAQAFGESRQDLRWKELDEMIKRVQVNDSVLDVGCGTGRLCVQLKDRQAAYLGLDVSEQQLAQARRLCPTGSFTPGSMLHLQFPDNEFDHVFMIASLHHILTVADRRRALAEAVRVLKPGGHLFITVMALWQPRFWPLFFKKGKGKATVAADQLRFIKWNDVFVPWKWKATSEVYRYYHAFGLTELRALLADLPLNIEELQYVRNGLPAAFYQAKNLICIARKK